MTSALVISTLLTLVSTWSDALRLPTSEICPSTLLPPRLICCLNRHDDGKTEFERLARPNEWDELDIYLHYRDRQDTFCIVVRLNRPFTTSLQNVTYDVDGESVVKGLRPADCLLEVATSFLSGERHGNKYFGDSHYPINNTSIFVFQQLLPKNC